jgi:hypothetical protein
VGLAGAIFFAGFEQARLDLKERGCSANHILTTDTVGAQSLPVGAYPAAAADRANESGYPSLDRLGRDDDAYRLPEGESAGEQVFVFERHSPIIGDSAGLGQCSAMHPERLIMMQP